MSEFTIRSDSVDVEQIMKQIRTRILEKRGADYTEEQIRELATVRLEKFLDPKNLRSDLLEQFRKSRPAVDRPSRRRSRRRTPSTTRRCSPRIAAPLRFIRKLLRPILKLFFNPNTLNQILHTQAQFNVDMLKRESRREIEFDRSRAEWNVLYYEVLHNLVLETTRNGIEVKNLRMRVESLASRLDFSERRVRALEGVVQYRPEAVAARAARAIDASEPTAGDAERRRRDRSKDACPAGAAGCQATAGRRQRAAPPPAAAAPARRRRGRRRGPGCPGAQRTVRRGGRRRMPDDDGEATSPRRRRRRRGRDEGDEPPSDDYDGGEPADELGANRRARARRLDDTPMTARCTREPDPSEPGPTTTSSEDRDCRPALRRGHQRRRRAARALRRRASGAARPGRGVDDLRDRLHHVAQRAARRRRNRHGVTGAALSRSRASATRSSSASGRSTSSRSSTRSATSSRGSTPKDRPAPS